MQSGPIILRESLESVCVYLFLQRTLEGCQRLPNLFANLMKRAQYHIKASSDFAELILADNQHSLVVVNYRSVVGPWGHRCLVAAPEEMEGQPTKLPGVQLLAKPKDLISPNQTRYL